MSDINQTDAGRAERGGPSYAVVGATGQQGGATAKALLTTGAQVRALVRDLSAPSAQALRKLGAQLVLADLDDPASLRSAFTDTAGVFAMTTFTGPAGTEGEVTHGIAIADAARDATVPHVVYSSVGGADRKTGIPHFESKWRVEEYLRSIGLRTTVVRPAFFMDNFANYMPPERVNGTLVLRMPLPKDIPLQLIAASDIGVVAAVALTEPDRIPHGALEIAGDELTGEQIAEKFGRHQGMPARYEALPVDSVADPDSQAMMSWFSHLPAYQADFAATRALAPHLKTFSEWVKETT